MTFDPQTSRIGTPSKEHAPATIPIWQTTEVNQQMGLYLGPAILRTDVDVLPVTVTISLDWLPSPHVSFSTEISVGFGWSVPDSVTLELNAIWPGLEYPGSITHRTTSSGSGTSVKGTLEACPEELNSTLAKSLKFHVANLRPFLGGPIVQDTSTWLGRGFLTAIPWSVTLDQVRACPGMEQLDNSGGFGITHIGKVYRSDNTPFSLKDAAPLFYALRSFLAFCNGRPCGPLLAVAFDELGVDKWTSWDLSPTAPSRHVASWWNRHVGVEPFVSFGKFFELWNDEKWAEPLMMAVYWYLAANEPGGRMESAIVLSQLAFECLADTLIVEVRRAVSADGLKNLKAHDKLRLLLNLCEIPTEIPAVLAKLSVVGKGRNWDGPGAITMVRNCLVHPTSNNRERLRKDGVTLEVEMEVMSLSMYYLELTILSILGYQGKFLNRLKARSAWELETVPWA